MSVAPTSVTVPTVQQYVSELATQLLVSPKPECLLCYVGRMREQVVPTLRALGADPPRSPMSCRGWVSLDFEATMDRAMKGQL